MNEAFRLHSVEAAPYDTAMLALELQRALSACADLPDFLGTLSTRLPRLLPARDRVSLAFLEPDGQWMRVYRVLPALESPPARLPRVRVDGTVVGQVAQDGLPRVVGDVWSDPNITFGHASHDGIRSTASVPVTIAGRVVGVMNIGSRTPGACHERMLGELLAVAAVVGPAVYAAERVFLTPGLQNAPVEAENGLVGASPAFRALVRHARRAALSDAPLLITGETGVGKTALASAIHRWSGRRDGAFVPLHVAACGSGELPELSRAAGGTLFLDEIAEASAALQARLVPAVEDPSAHAPPPFRLIAATNRDLHAAVQRGEFRRDLLYRLDVVSLHVPPLRERPQDLAPLVDSVLSRLSQKHGGTIGLAHEARERLQAHDWPGNIRELESVLTRAALIEDSDELTLAGWNPKGGRARVESAAPNDWPTRDENERRYIERVIAHTGGVLEGARGAAKRLGMQPSTLRSRMKRLGVKVDTARQKGEG